MPPATGNPFGTSARPGPIRKWGYPRERRVTPGPNRGKHTTTGGTPTYRTPRQPDAHHLAEHPHHLAERPGNPTGR